jgi:all-trans-retinol 13,14-reductase
MFDEKRFLKPFVKRIRGLKNTPSSFIVHLVLKEKSFKYLNHNIYQFVDEYDVWDTLEYEESNWPKSYFLCTPASSKSDEFAESMSIMAYMDFDQTKEWEKTFNTVAEKAKRGEEYEAFKREKEEQVIIQLEKQYPDIRSKIAAIYSSTPVTYRDYIGDKTGSLYGIAKDSNSPLKTQINSKTKVKNLSLTGQNLVFHGVLGVTLGAFVTCFDYIDKHKLMEKVKNS